MIRTEKATLSRYTDGAIQYNRHHYLRACEPEDLDCLEKHGITDDFTMGYADVAGFRLGTSRPVHWINPETRRISSLILHPLCIMDVTLFDKKYMNLSDEEAHSYTKELIRRITEVNGELVILWHNNSFSEQHFKTNFVNKQKAFYQKLLDELI